MIINAKRTML